MPVKHDYLADLAQHANSTAGETAARLDASESAVLEAFRRLRKQDLIAGDGKRPEKFSLTDAGREQLAVLGIAGNSSAVSASPETKLSQLETQLSETVADVKGIFGLVNRLVGKKAASHSQSDVEEESLEELQAENDALMEEKKALETEMDRHVRVLEFYATQVGLHCADDWGSAKRLEARAEKLGVEVGSETAEDVKSLVRLEEALQGEQGRFFGPRKSKMRELMTEIGQLREKLGLAPLESPMGAAEDN